MGRPRLDSDATDLQAGKLSSSEILIWLKRLIKADQNTEFSAPVNLGSASYWIGLVTLTILLPACEQNVMVVGIFQSTNVKLKKLCDGTGTKKVLQSCQISNRCFQEIKVHTIVSLRQYLPSVEGGKDIH